jgi:hypothetical protein
MLLNVVSKWTKLCSIMSYFIKTLLEFSKCAPEDAILSVLCYEISPLPDFTFNSTSLYTIKYPSMVFPYKCSGRGNTVVKQLQNKVTHGENKIIWGIQYHLQASTQTKGNQTYGVPVLEIVIHGSIVFFPCLLTSHNNCSLAINNCQTAAQLPVNQWPWRKLSALSKCIAEGIFLIANYIVVNSWFIARTIIY